MQTQKDLVGMHPRHGIMNIDVLSFERLAHRIFEEVGGEHRKILEDTGKNMVLRRLAEENKDRLTLSGRQSEKTRLYYRSQISSVRTGAVPDWSAGSGTDDGQKSGQPAAIL